MSEKNPTNTTEWRRADHAFSVAPIQNVIDERRREKGRYAFSGSELMRLGLLANQAIEQQAGDDVYSREVFVSLHKGEYVYDVADGHDEAVPERMFMEEDTVLYGYLNGFYADTFLYDGKVAFLADFQAHPLRMVGKSHSYLVPMAIEGSEYGVRCFDAPTPVAEDGVRVSTTKIPRSYQENNEQGLIHSLLRIAEQELFDGELVDTETIETKVNGWGKYGGVMDLGALTTACNYYFQKRIHERDPWCVVPDRIMDRLDGVQSYDPEFGFNKGMWHVVTEELTVVGIDLCSDLQKGVHCTIYGQSSDGALFRSQRHDPGKLLLYCQPDVSI